MPSYPSEGVHVGVPQQVPEYTTTAYDVTIQGSSYNFYDFFSVLQNNTYGFSYDQPGSQAVFSLGPDPVQGYYQACSVMTNYESPLYDFSAIKIDYDFHQSPNYDPSEFSIITVETGGNSQYTIHLALAESGSGSVTIDITNDQCAFAVGFNKEANDNESYATFTMQLLLKTPTGNYINQDTAAEVQGVWVGVEETVATYETQNVTVTDSNVDSLFTVSHTSSGGFLWKSSNSRFQAGAGPSGTTYFTTTWTAKQDIDSLTFTYQLSKSSNTSTSYYFRIQKNGTQVVKATSSVSGATYTFTDLKENDVIAFTFTKSSSNTSYYAYFTAAGTIKVQTGSTTQEVARPVLELFIGDPNGVARRSGFMYDDNY